MIEKSLAPPSTSLYTFPRTPALSRPLQFRGPRESAGFRVSGASFFYRLKCDLLAFEIEQAGIPPYRWEKKGSSLYTTQNVLKYAELRHATARLLNRIERDAGMVFYVGEEKARSSDEHDSKGLYRAVLGEAISRLHDFCERDSSLFMAILDEQHDKQSRDLVVSDVSREMFEGSRRFRMIEPPIQAESHLFQTLQCADWICGLVGRAGCYLVAPAEYEDLIWVPKYFSQRLARVAPISGIRQRGADVTAEPRATEH